MSRSDTQARTFTADQLRAAIGELGGSPEPGYLDDIVTQAHRTRQRPAWTFSERWLPMTTFLAAPPIPLTRPRPTHTLRPLAILIVLALLALVAAALLFAAGSRTQTAWRNGLIAYDAFGDIWTMRPDGSDRRQLTSGPALDISPTWSPDGSRITFASWPNEEPIGPDGEGFEAAARRWMAQSPFIVAMDADGSGVTTIGTMKAPGPSAFSWAPDSTRLVYDTGTDLRIGSIDEPGTIELIPLGSPQRSSPAWSPDGRSIAFKGGDAADDTLGLWTIDVDTGAARLISEPIGPDEDITGATWAPDGTSIAFLVGPASGGAFDVHIAATDGGGETPVTTDGPDEYWPAWAPDGSRLAFDRVVVPANNLVQVVVFDPVTSTELMIESDPLFGIPLVWSPDSTEIVAQLPEDAEAASDWGWASHLVFLDATGLAAPRLIEADGAFGTESWQRLTP